MSEPPLPKITAFADYYDLKCENAELKKTIEQIVADFRTVKEDRDELRKDKERLELLIKIQNSNPYYLKRTDRGFSRQDIDAAMQKEDK